MNQTRVLHGLSNCRPTAREETEVPLRRPRRPPGPLAVYLQLNASFVLGWALFVLPVYAGWVHVDIGVAALIGITLGAAAYLTWLYRVHA